MSYRGHVQNGVVVLDEPADFAEGALVLVEVLEATPSEALHPVMGILPADIDVRAEHADDLFKT